MNFETTKAVIKMKPYTKFLFGGIIASLLGACIQTFGNYESYSLPIVLYAIGIVSAFVGLFGTVDNIDKGRIQ